MLINRSAPQPRSRKTPRGGRRMARMILQMSLWVAMSVCPQALILTSAVLWNTQRPGSLSTDAIDARILRKC